MNIKDIYLDSLKELGYTEIEARFIYIVATHSGYFTVRQFLDFADAKRGKRSDKLADKLVRHRHASAEKLPLHSQHREWAMKRSGKPG